jgi:formyltetrahydrofolate-dependent phosphoribosylglycinamide formyltransferase
MLKKLAQHWRVTPLQAILILCTFAVGGFTCSKVGGLIIAALNIKKSFGFYIPYLLLITLVWPICVLGVSIIFGQFTFFKTYVGKLLGRLVGKKKVTAKNIAIFASGAGSNAQKIIQYFKNHAQINVALIITNNANAGVLQHAKSYKIPSTIVTKQQFLTNNTCLNQLQQQKIDYIILAGFLLQVPTTLIQAYPNKIINIHPALLPKHGGKGMYGMHVHKAVIANADAQSGITIHFVDEQYDHGATIYQATCAVSPTDTPETLAQKVHALEHAHFAPTIEKVIVEN